jgi:DNA-binding Lrp family transcriptional regulator
MKNPKSNMRPQDVVILLKMIAKKEQEWFQIPLAEELYMSQSEISESISRSKYAGLLTYSSKKVNRNALMEFLQYGITYVFPQHPGTTVRGIVTAHSAPPLNKIINSSELYVWPSAKGDVRGQSITPLYPSVIEAVKRDDTLYELLALVDAIRVGKAREKEIAIKELRNRIAHGE